jgi:hypothetical protein
MYNSFLLLPLKDQTCQSLWYPELQPLTVPLFAWNTHVKYTSVYSKDYAYNERISGVHESFNHKDYSTFITYR